MLKDCKLDRHFEEGLLGLALGTRTEEVSERLSFDFCAVLHRKDELLESSFEDLVVASFSQFFSHCLIQRRIDGLVEDHYHLKKGSKANEIELFYLSENVVFVTSFIEEVLFVVIV